MPNTKPPSECTNNFLRPLANNRHTATLPSTPTGIRILIKDLPLLKDKIHNDDVQKALTCIIEQAKRRPDAKTACLELEEKIKELRDSTDDAEGGDAGQQGEQQQQPRPVSDSEAMPPPLRPVPKSVKAKKKVTRRTRRDEEEDEEEDDDEDYENRSSSRNNSTTRSSCKFLSPVLFKITRRGSDIWWANFQEFLRNNFQPLLLLVAHSYTSNRSVFFFIFSSQRFLT